MKNSKVTEENGLSEDFCANDCVEILET